MRIPDHVIILGKSVPIEFREKVYDDETGEERDAKTNGETILISEDVSKKDIPATILHEMWHCYIRRSGLYQRADHREDIEEIEAEGFANIITDNFILRSKHV